MDLEQKHRQLEDLKRRLEHQNNLPHLYGWPWYKWAYDFFTSTNEINLLCAANQISKSSTQIRKCIDWATDQKKWPKLWRNRPNQFWYLYPSADVATVEFEKKWVPEFMPRGEYKKSGYYGWDTNYARGKIESVDFNNGLSVYFKTYAQNPKVLQSGSCYAIFADEELPDNLYDELMIRLAATQGYFHMVFTATLNQDFWRRAIQPDNADTEILKEAWKKQVSMYECLHYIDGSASPWTIDRIKKVEARCKSKAEIERRVHGKFIAEAGRKYHAFDASRHYVQPFRIPADYHWYTGVDVGSGGKENHPSAIVFVAVRPDHQKGYVVRTWRGDGVETSSGDVLDKYREVRGSLKPVLQSYDPAAVDFGTISSRQGEGFVKAQKNHELGEDIINTLFKNNMLQIFDTDDNRKLGSELTSLMRATPKNKAKDDLSDATRYAIVPIPWDFENAIEVTEEVKKDSAKKPQVFKTERELFQEQIEQRRAGLISRDSGRINDEWAELQGDIEEWNSLY